MIGNVGNNQIEITEMRVKAPDGTTGTVVSFSRSLKDDIMVRVIWDRWTDWCYPEWDEPTTYEFLSELVITTKEAANG